MKSKQDAGPSAGTFESCLGELQKIIKVRAEFEGRVQKKREERRELENKMGADYLDGDADAIRALAAVSAEEAILQRAFEGSEKRARQVAAVVGRVAMQKERELRKNAAANKAAAFGVMRMRLAPFFADKIIDGVIHLTEVGAAACRACEQAPSAVSVEEGADTIHPNATPEDVLRRLQKIEAAAVEAEAFAKRISKL